MSRPDEQADPLTLEGRVAVISPHPDDAVLSLGASIRHATTAGHPVRVVTVFAGDEAADREASPWDTGGGFRTASEAARARAAEDDAACGLVGAEAVRLPYLDNDYERELDGEEILRDIADAVGERDVLLIPGFPLRHPDHLWLSQLLDGLNVESRMAHYAEQPYAALERVSPAEAQPGRPWRSVKASPTAQAVKLRACRAYRSQIPLLGGMPVLGAILSYESKLGGESVCWLDG